MELAHPAQILVDRDLVLRDAGGFADMEPAAQHASETDLGPELADSMYKVKQEYSCLTLNMGVSTVFLIAI